MAVRAREKGLGRGLDALLGAPGEAAREGETLKVPLSRIEPNAAQPRTVFEQEGLEALAESIRENGLISPIAVRRLTGGDYQIIAGERRWRACRMAGLSEVPVVVLEADEGRVLELALIENLQRKDLSPIEEGEAFRALMEDFGLTQEEVARRVGRSRPAVANALRLLSLPEALKDRVKSGSLSGGHARALLPLEEAARMEALAQRIEREGLSVRQTEALVKKALKEEKENRPHPEAEAGGVDYARALSRELTQTLGRRVQVAHGKKKGTITLEYYGLDDLERLTGLLKREG